MMSSEQDIPWYRMLAFLHTKILLVVRVLARKPYQTFFYHASYYRAMWRCGLRLMTWTMIIQLISVAILLIFFRFLESVRVGLAS